MHRAPLLEKGTGPTRNGGQKKRPRGTLFRVQGGSQGLTTDARPRGSVVVFVRRRTDTRVGGGHFLIPDPGGILGRGARF